MSDPFVAEVRMFGFTFPPTGWAFCNGQLMPISQNTALFALVGTTYGGDGKSTFALPNLQGSVGMHPNPPNSSNGLSERVLGETAGSETVTLVSNEMPFHAHSFNAANANAATADPNASALAKGRYTTGPTSGAVAFYQTAAPNVQMAPNAMAPAGGNLPHNNMMPYLVLNFCIAMQGIFPQRP